MIRGAVVGVGLSEIEAELEAKGYPPDSHDYLYE